MQKLRFPVGPGKVNQHEDVKLIQGLLNNILKLTPKLQLDGKFGAKTSRAVFQFQSNPGVTPKPDNVVMPDGPTFKALVGNAKVESKKAIPANVQKFIDLMLASAKKTKKDWSVPIAVLIAQSALETGWGSSVVGNAYFGIKGKSSSGASSTFQTHEVIGGKSVALKDSFRAYKDIAEAADDYGRFLNENPRYKTCFLYKNDPEKFVTTLAAAGYATDPLYATKLIKIIRAYGLASYDQ